ncbi:hypothetical protein [Amycolatopsis albispora]|uniref:Uncharacterized protein n=1 Tax=Amycolatopsis albispora TaxID=1804986 RepID=A0A344L9C9_9PSEU|nr:hypothetical protein [Amycolatopsis albispora]AXB44653.1 hypothetical protein A4R43_20870 [Amycolatopsis albispora]
MTAALPRWWLPPFTLATAALLLARTEWLIAAVSLLWTTTAMMLASAALVGVTRRCLPSGTTVLNRLAIVLPRAEREHWRAELVSVLHACEGRERTRQAIGFLTALPVTAVTSRVHR